MTKWNVEYFIECGSLIIADIEADDIFKARVQGQRQIREHFGIIASIGDLQASRVGDLQPEQYTITHEKYRDGITITTMFTVTAQSITEAKREGEHQLIMLYREGGPFNDMKVKRVGENA